MEMPAQGEGTHPLNDFGAECVRALSGVYDEGKWSHLSFNTILEHLWGLIEAANNHIARKEPWKLARNNPDELKEVMANIWNSLRLTALSLYPFMPSTAEEMWIQLGLKSLTDEVAQSFSLPLAGGERYPMIFTWAWRPAYEIKVAKGNQLFPRIETGGKPKMATTSVGREEKEKSTDNYISIEDFDKVELKIGKIMAAERVEKSDKLIKLKVDIGEERQVVAGIGKAYDPEYLVGKEIVVVANLKPAKLMGVESRGMLLAASDENGKPSILILDREVKPGTRVK